MALRRTVLLTAELALLSLTVVVTISLERLFTDLAFLPDLLVLVVGSHLVAAACRRADLSMAWATPISGLALVVLGTAVFYPDVSALIVPTSETLTTIGDDLREAWQVFSDDSAPVPPVRGFVVTSAVLVWYGVFLADWAAFRLRSPLEAVAPATAVFVFASLLGVDRNEIAHGMLFSGGLLAVLLTMRAERQIREEVWVASGAANGVRTTLQMGAAAGVVAVIVAALIAPQIPGATAQPLLDITEINNDPETRSVLSPLVEVSTSLVNQSDVELFSVRVDPSQQDYWRLMALTKFEDEIWRRSSNFDEARGEVASDIDTSVPTRTLRQEITIASLGNIYLPAAYEITDIVDNGGTDLEYEVATGALVVERSLDQIPRGLSYTIDSRVPDYSPAELPADATRGLSSGFISEHTQLPDACATGESPLDTGCWPAEITQLAQQITANATTDHERVLALQNFFLDPARFRYNLQVALQHDINSMTEFLQVGQGYCEQFASTFAAMARSLGIPSRVAVGFTWGDWDPARGEYVVSGKHAHAWPEIHFADHGWIIFDPTPGRSRGLDDDITGTGPAQQTGPQDDPNSIVEPPSTTVQPDQSDPGSSAGAVPPGRTPTTTLPGSAAAAGAAPDGGESGANGVLLALAVLGGLVALAGIVPGAQYLRRRRRLARVAADPVGRGEMAWDDALGALRLLGLEKPVTQTPHEFASLVERSQRELGPIRLLADHVTRLRYSPGDDAVAEAIAAQDAAAEIVKLCRARVGRTRVIGHALDPRALLHPAPVPLIGR